VYIDYTAEIGNFGIVGLEDGHSDIVVMPDFDKRVDRRVAEYHYNVQAFDEIGVSLQY
jgi:hypothetical protein